MATAKDGALSRRDVLVGAGASLAFWSAIPRVAASGRDPRLLVVILRGGVDGLATVAPVSDPSYAGHRQNLAIPRSGDGAGLNLDGFFALNPAMGYLHGLYRKRQALIMHAVATPYRQRSHFDGQDVLESGLPAVGRSDDGWLNRALQVLQVDGRANPKGLSMGPVVPLSIRGRANVLSWIPKTVRREIGDSTIARLQDLYGQTDPALAKAFADGIEMARIGADAQGHTRSGGRRNRRGRRARNFIVTAKAAAKLMSRADGPRIGVLSYNGWDTHANEGVLKGRLYNHLSGLDLALKTYAEGMGTVWSDTVVVVVTEFGRTVRVNGTRGTDHGVGTLALVVGGGINGGRVIADWPGLRDQELFEGRDLMPTQDLRGVFKGVLSEHLGIGKRVLARRVFPNSQNVKPMSGLIT